MREYVQQEIALSCLRLAIDFDPLSAIDRAAEFYAFVTGEAADDAKAKLDAVREVIKP